MRAVHEGLVVVGASAGSGKTHRLTTDLTDRIGPASSDRLPVDGLVAVTYTRRAEAELRSRLRRALLAAGDTDEVLRLPLAYLGTVHAVGLRLLQEHALDVGLSPRLGILPDDRGLLLRSALERALDPAQREELDELAHRLAIRWDHRTRRYDWLTPVADLMDLARANRIEPEALGPMAERSAEALLALLPRASKARRLDAALDQELDAAHAALSRLARSKPQKNIQAALEEIESIQRMRRRGEHAPWSHWIKAANLDGGAKAAPLLTDLVSAAQAVESHPRLHAELRAFITAVYAAARRGLELYAAEKRRHATVDYVDMIDQALALVEQPAVASELAPRLRYVVVDEFQDTSPIQLALFLRLHAIAGASTWVGDPKQCIFEYAGADPELMDAVLRWQREHGHQPERLTTNYRSRAPLVEACSDLFAGAFASHGLSPEDVRVRPHRRELPAQARKLPPFGVWWLDARNSGDEAHAVAGAVCELLDAPDATPVVDRATGELRPPRAGDVALLVATNAHAERLAGALHERGVPVSLPQTGLLATLEGTLLVMALRWVLDERDSLAAAVLSALHEFDGVGPDAWLERLLRQARLEPAERTPLPASWRDALAPLRARVALASPAELVDATLDALDAPGLAARWPEPAQRLANLEALRQLARVHDDTARQRGDVPTPTGLLLFLDDCGSQHLVRGELASSDDQFLRGDADAVTVITYHRAKGLEWPVVVLLDLDRGPRADVFSVALESDGAAFDPAQPLSGRWIRYWPYPFGPATKSSVHTAAAQSPVGRRAAERHRRERARLLYVGFTRARDHLIFAARRGKTAWLDELCAPDGRVLFPLPPEGARERIVAALPPAPAGPPSPARWFARAPAVARPRYRITPSEALDDPDLEPLRPLEALRLHAGIASALPRDAEARAVGLALHACLAAPPDATPRLLSAYGLAAVAPAAVEQLRLAFDAFVDERWPGAVRHVEIPVRAYLGDPDAAREIEGVIDLLVDTPEGFILIDHKTFPGATESAWLKKASEYGGQMAAYARAVEVATGRNVAEVWLHFGVGGGMVRMGG